MTGTEFKKAITLLRDCENRLDFIVRLYDLVDQEEEIQQEVKQPKKESLKHKIKAAKEKTCIVCGETFKPGSNRQMKCSKCKQLEVDEDIMATAKELAAM